MGDHERGKPEIRFSLAAASWEKQQIGGLTVDVTTIDQSAQIEQNEGELEGPGKVANILIGKAIKTLMLQFFPDPEKAKKAKAPRK